MKKLPPIFIHGCFALLLVAVLVAGWWLAGERGDFSLSEIQRPSTAKGPIEPAFCGPTALPRLPPPIDSPFGLHLYAMRPKGIIYALPAMAIMDQQSRGSMKRDVAWWGRTSAYGVVAAAQNRGATPSRVQAPRCDSSSTSATNRSGSFSGLALTQHASHMRALPGAHAGCC